MGINTTKMKEALLKIAQMSDCGSPELTILRMKEIASEALNHTQPKEQGADDWKVVENKAHEYAKREHERDMRENDAHETYWEHFKWFITTNYSVTPLSLRTPISDEQIEALAEDYARKNYARASELQPVEDAEYIIAVSKNSIINFIKSSKDNPLHNE